MSQTERRWDLLLRLCHWTIVLLVVLQFATAEFGFLDLEWHFYFGYALLGVLGLRMVWGFIGPPAARFSSSVHGPSALIDYVRRFRQRKSSDYPAHNPLGALAAFALWLVLLGQGVSGLLTSDEVMFDGPLVQYFPEWERFASSWHHQLNDVLLILIALHVVAVAVYYLVKKENLLGPMIHGRRK
ncbi:MAG: cytochrome b/b6 domain-containing protein [Ahniella sp.]|nr:cytochrome b/b6 domain-containing protein [Ahniella sp.]